MPHSRLRNKLLIVPAALAVICALPVAAAGAHSFGPGPVRPAWTPPAPKVEVSGVVTTAPATGADTFVASAYVVVPPAFGTPATAPTSTPNTPITTGTTTSIRVDGRSEPVADLAAGDKFTALYSGTPTETLAAITGGTALSISAVTPPPTYVFYGFVGAVTATTSNSVSVSVTTSAPTVLFSGTDPFTVGRRTIVFGSSSSSPFGSLAGIHTGDVVAGGLIAKSGQTASAIEADPLQFLLDFPTSTPASPAASNAAIKRTEARAEALLKAEKRRLAKPAQKTVKHTK